MLFKNRFGKFNSRLVKALKGRKIYNPVMNIYSRSGIVIFQKNLTVQVSIHQVVTSHDPHSVGASCRYFLGGCS